MKVIDIMKLIDKSVFVYIVSVFGCVWQGEAREFDEAVYFYSPMQFIHSIETASCGSIVINVKS